MAIYIKQNNQLKKVGLGTMYEKTVTPLDPIEYREEHRDTNWPFIPLPNEIHSVESSDCIYFLFGKDNVNEWCIPFVNVTGSNLSVNIKKYNNTTLISEDTTKTITSATTLNIEYNSTDSDWSNWNYVLMKVTGTITDYNMNVVPAHSGAEITPSNMLLEVSGYCSNYSITTQSGKKYYNLTYFGIGGSCSNIAMTSMFNNCYSLQAVHTLDTSLVTRTNSMFISCYSLQAIPMLNTSNVTNMNSMFKSCYTLQTIPQLDTSSVTDMNSMFRGCSSLKAIPMLNTSNVTNMSNMFYECGSLQAIPQLDTSSVTDMETMFGYCYTLQTIPQLDTSSVTKMSSMFNYCYVLQAIPMLNTSNVTNMNSMFVGCYTLQTIPTLDTSKVTDMNSMFKSCSSLKAIPTLNVSLVTDMAAMFTSCTLLQDVGNTSFKTSVSLSPSSCFTYKTIMTIINNLATVSTSQTLTVPTYIKPLLTQEDIAIATNKGWSIA